MKRPVWPGGRGVNFNHDDEADCGSHYVSLEAARRFAERDAATEVPCTELKNGRLCLGCPTSSVAFHVTVTSGKVPVYQPGLWARGDEHGR